MKWTYWLGIEDARSISAVMLPLFGFTRMNYVCKPIHHMLATMIPLTYVPSFTDSVYFIHDLLLFILLNEYCVIIRITIICIGISVLP